ncbi:MAX dimerization protein MGA a isoform X2 [Anarhichas minor]|uniref:MAX dimerization protein MGA a isoform X2 n=1 Tax=Anarhichas minor TaxID=65739 RepID=UPI003F731820
MASKKKQKGMVFHQDGATSPAAAPAADHPPACFAVPKPGKASEGGMEQNTHVTKEEADMMCKPNRYPSKEPIRTSDGLLGGKQPASSNPQPDNLSPDSICKGIKVTLDNNSMWNEFFRCKTEMIMTKQGSRMFPYCRFRISGLQPCRKYFLLMDIQPLDNSRYKWTGKSWQVAEKAECHVKSQPFAHPESPSTGQHWMQNPVSFYKLKLTNSISDQEGNAVLHPMHRYLPRLHVVQTDKAAKDIKLNGPTVVTFTFHQTEFMAVTAYQNSRFSQLKVDYNPFAKGLKEEGSGSCGLKLKLISGKDSRKDGGMTANEQHPVKKSLKSLLANHKPRSSKAVDTKLLVSGDPHKNSTTNEDQSAANVSGESLCNSRPAQKLFSELIREAHISLHRCNLDQLGINNRTEQSNSKTTSLKSNGQDDPKRDRVSAKTSPAKKGETVVTKRKVREDKDPFNSLNSKDNVRTDCFEVGDVVAGPTGSQNSSVDSDRQRKPEAPSEVKSKQHKRPLPLPALALFLKQHSSKSKLAKSKLDSPPPALPSECRSDSQSSGAAPECPPSDHGSKATGPSKDFTGDITESNTSGQTKAHLHPDEVVLNVTGPADETARKPSSPSFPDTVAITDPKGLRPDDLLTSDSVAESRGPEPAVPDGTPVLPNSDQSFCVLGPSLSTIPSSLATSPILSPPLDTVLPAPNYTLPSDSPKSDSLLPDPECSLFGFEPLSPASSPEPLPSLPISLALELNSTPSESTLKAVSPEELQHSEDSAASVFKWHTVLPPPEPYVDPSFTTFQLAQQTLPLASVTSPLLPLQTLSHSEPQTLDTSTSPDPDPSFQDNEQPLPFPGELSPLALQMTLSPTFSSLDGDGLSPTPSIADLVHFFSTNDDLGMGVDFSNTEAVACPCPPPSTVEANAQEPSQQVPPIPATKPCRHKKKSRRRKLADKEEKKMGASTYTKMQPNLEEVEEQLFISFTSKEALRLHVADSSDGTASQPQTTPEGHLQQTAVTPENVETAEALEETTTASEKILLKDLKQMRHGQVIHPVLQDVGLKMNLLDPTLAIDLQYLGVRMPIPPPGVSLEPLSPELPPPQGVSAAFVSRTGKTTDVTQIKGWREKFTPSEAASTATQANPEAGPSSDLPKKNLSAFCSDMLDEYLENEGKLIDQRAASFTQPVVEPVVYKLPTRSTSYVRTLDSVLKKQTASSPTSDLISGFIPPSKRPKLNLRETKTFRRQRGPKPRTEPAPAPALSLSPTESNLSKQLSVQIPVPPPSENTYAVTEPHRSKRHQLKVQFDPTEPLTPSAPPKRRRKFKPKTLTQTLSPSKPSASPPGVSQDMAPLESDSELGPVQQSEKDSRPVMTRGLLRQKDLEDGVLWEGRPRTSITEERAAIALTSLFTLKGFVRENPTAPIQLVQRQAPPCLNESCRLGCLCSSLSHCSRISHCGRPDCMFGCSCLKQKVVLLKNLDGSDSSSPQPGRTKRRRRRRRMKMAYVLKEADSVSQPAERVRTLWKRGGGDSDPEPVHVPEPEPVHVLEPAALSHPSVRTDDSSCARVRVYEVRKRRRTRKNQNESLDNQETSKDVKPKDVHLKRLRQKETKTKPCNPLAGDAVQPTPPDRPPSPSEPKPKPSKRLTIVAECKWAGDGDRNLVLKTLCEAMAQNQLDQPFWIRDYLVSPISRTEEAEHNDCCIHYRMHISRPKLEREEPVRPQRHRKWRETKPQQEPLKQVVVEEEPPEDWQREVEEEEEEEEEEEAPPEDWQREVEEGDIEEEEEEEGSTEKEMKKVSKRKMMVSMALPFLTGVSSAGFLSANRKQLGGTDHLVQVNGKLYPLAKIQLGKMGALHPANRLAAYLTGRVGSNRKHQGSSSSSSKAGPTPPTTSSVVPAPPPRSQPSVTMLTLPTPPTVLQPAAVKVDQSAASSHHSAGEAPKEAGTQVVKVKVYPGLKGGASEIRVVPAAPVSSAPISDSQVSSSVASPVNLAPKGSQLLMLQVPAPPGKLPLPPPPTSSTSQTMVLQPVQSKSGVQYYRRPDGKLVQLVPISQLRSVNPNLSAQRVLPAASLQTPVGNQTPPLTTVTSILPSSSTSSSFTTPLHPGLLAQTRTCTFKILPSGSSRDPIIVTCPKVPSTAMSPGSFTLLQSQPPPVSPSSSLTLLQSPPPAPPMSLISLKPSTGGGAELGVKMVTVSPAPAGPVGVLVQNPIGTRPSPVPSPEPASDLVDLDIVCVDDEAELVTMERGGGAKYMLDGEGPEGEGRSSETDNSSDFGDELDGEETKQPNVKTHRHLLNALEKSRRVTHHQLFKGLRREVGLSEETSKVFTLKKAVQVIHQLRTTDSDLEEKKRRLKKRRDEFLTFIAPSSERSAELSEGGRTGSRDLMEDLFDSDEPMEDLSDETVVTTATNVEESGRLNAAQRRLKRIMRNMRNVDSECLRVKELVGALSLTKAFRGLRSVMKTRGSSKRLLLDQARQEIQTLQSESATLKSMKICLNQQRDAFIRDISLRSGKSQQRILVELQHQSTKQRETEKPKRNRTANQLPAARGGASDPPASSGLQQRAPQAPPTAKRVHQPQSVLHLAPPGVFHNASVVRDRPRTVPNILSRSRTPAASSSFKAMLPGEVLSLVRAVLPGQQLLAMSPLMASPSPGMTTVTLNLPNLTNQQISSAPLTFTNLTAANFNNLLQLVQPSSTQQMLQAPQKILQAPQRKFQLPQQILPPPQQKILPVPQQLLQPPQQIIHPPPQQQQQLPTSPSLLVSAGSDFSSDQIKDQDRPESSLPAPPSTQGGPGPRADGRVAVGEPLGEDESLTSLLNEIVFLNQQTVPLSSENPSSEEAAVGGATEQGHAHSPWLLELDSDSDDLMETTWGGRQLGPANENANALAPPPLLQMKVGGAKVADPPSSDRAAGGEDEGGGGGSRREGCVAWRPMPRLVPLGLRGNAPS